MQYVGSSSLMRDQTQAPALGVCSLSHCTTRKVPTFFLNVNIWQMIKVCHKSWILLEAPHRSNWLAHSAWTVSSRLELSLDSAPRESVWGGGRTWRGGSGLANLVPTSSEKRAGIEELSVEWVKTVMQTNTFSCLMLPAVLF